MNFALILVSGVDQTLSTAHIAHIQSLLDEMAIPMTDTPPRWLGQHQAAEIYLLDQLTTDQLKTLKLFGTEQQIDIFCIAQNNRRKALLLADMDSTIIADETLDNIAHIAGIGNKVADITARAMNGELNFKEALRERVSMLKGQPLSILKQALEETTLNSGAQTLIKTMAKHGATCVLVSGGFTMFTEYVARKCGFAYNHGNILDVSDTEILGTVRDPILDKSAKEDFLNHYMAKLSLTAADTMAVGDGANDLAMLDAAALGIGYYPKPSLEKALRHTIKYSDLTTLLYLQGFTKDKFIDETY
ncbi:MAG: phosphoserine phosphatase SerB [Alphaproteobacteria bacterium]|nr:phosphoserine phosphatase SerB [Alphaproteobacteria bacterium]|tara:strand:+ start:699 stop:1607 length:909 start_codon:yes stop_codon:yes gene_type:complete